MYAIIQSGGKQYRVQEGDEVDVELLGQEDGSKVEFKEVLFFNDGNAEAGAPYLDKVSVTGEVLGTSAGDKITFIKYKKRQNERKKVGHRQKYSRVRITGIKKA
ncbi:MAG: 50S ribosomal protein L21 [Chlamydiia bacterium]|nr:50S ribosomal protein L21 [Chlamydiia bacterium]